MFIVFCFRTGICFGYCIMLRNRVTILNDVIKSWCGSTAHSKVAFNKTWIDGAAVRYKIVGERLV